MTDHNSEVKRSFTIQAEKFAAYHMSKAEYTDYLIRSIGAGGDEQVLEVAAGTCICGRALAPHVKHITCLDLTEAMLEQGRLLAAQAGIRNISFVTGNAFQLPYGNESFDLVITRLSLHHFTEPEIPFREMARVVKKGGKLVVWDLEAPAEELRAVSDRLETLRDPSHTRMLSRGEFEELFREQFTLELEELRLIPVRLESWMDLTDTSEPVRAEIIQELDAELRGGQKTGFDPYRKDGELYFNHRWLLLIGVRQ